MNEQPNILITGAAGFIGSSLVTELNDRGYNSLILVDNFNKPGKDQYLGGKFFLRRVNSDELFDFLDNGDTKVHFIFHLGGKTAYKTDFTNQNLLYPQILFEWCRSHGVPIVYASSAATYGAGSAGYDDNEELISALQPISDYGKSKQMFDLWMMENGGKSEWAGLKIFNAFGPNEYHKGQSISVPFKSFFEIRNTGEVVLYGSSDEKYKSGDQLRDFVYIKDIIGVFYWFFEMWLTQKNQFPSGIFNVGTGVGRSFNDVARAVFRAMKLPERIEYKPIPENVLKNYPEYIIAKTDKLRRAGYSSTMWSLEDAVNDLVRNYLIPGKIF